MMEREKRATQMIDRVYYYVDVGWGERDGGQEHIISLSLAKNQMVSQPQALSLYHLIAV